MISAIGPNLKDSIVNLRESDIRTLAAVQTEADINRKKDRKITKALFYTAPVAAGLTAAVLEGGKADKIFSKSVTGLAARASRGLKTAAIWTAGLAALDLMGFAKNKLAQKSPEVRKFDREHPLLSLGTMLAAGVGVLALVNKGAGKLGKIEAPKFMQNGTEQVAQFLEKNKFVNKMKNNILSVFNKTPDSLKEIGATALNWSPTMLLLGGLFHSSASARKEDIAFAKNYNAIKEAQMEAAKERIAELSEQQADAEEIENFAIL